MARVLIVSCLTLAVACGAPLRTQTARTSTTVPTRASECARPHTQSTIVPVISGVGSTIALAHGRASGQTLAYVADEDDAAIQIVDMLEGRAVARIPIEGRPSQLLFTADGRLLVLARDRATMRVFDPRERSLSALCEVPIGAVEPVALAETPDHDILVTTGWGHTLEGFASLTMTRTFAVDLPREPRAVIVSADGERAFVSHAVGGVMSVVDLAAHRARSVALTIPQDLALRRGMPARTGSAAGQGFALARAGARVLAPQVLVDPGDTKENTKGYGEAERTEVSDVAVADAITGAILPASLEGPDLVSSNPFRFTVERHDECLLPRAAAIHTETGSLLVACLGLDAVIAYDAMAASPGRAETQRWVVGAGPTGVAVDDTRRRAVVWSQFERALTEITLGGDALAMDDRVAPPPRRIAMPVGPSSAASITLGRSLFHAVGDTRIAKDGRACASCHPDGRDDGLTWSTPNGPRRTIALLRVAPHAPLSWSGGETDLKRRITTTLERLDGSGGLRSSELEALAAYVQAIVPPPARSIRDARVTRGEAIFRSVETGCSTCHSGPLFTDSRDHDVKSKTASDVGAAFNAPSLRFISGTGPYFHDGRYPTLHELLTKTDGMMGNTKQLSPSDLGALEAYLQAL